MFSLHEVREFSQGLEYKQVAVTNVVLLVICMSFGSGE